MRLGVMLLLVTLSGCASTYEQRLAWIKTQPSEDLCFATFIDPSRDPMAVEELYRRGAPCDEATYSAIWQKKYQAMPKTSYPPTAYQPTQPTYNNSAVLDTAVKLLEMGQPRTLSPATSQVNCYTYRTGVPSMPYQTICR